MRIVITGANGFIGKNLQIRLREAGHSDVACVTRSTDTLGLTRALLEADFVFHLAGVNRPQDPTEFTTGNAVFTAEICQLLAMAGRRAPLVITSSTQAGLDNPYGRSKAAAEAAARHYGASTGAQVHVFRLTNVFGKWARPNYNSAVATFCHNVSQGLPLHINDPAAPLRLVYVDDVIDHFLATLTATTQDSKFSEAGPVYEATVGEVVQIIQAFAASRSTLITPPVGTGLVRALYSTYLSYLPPASFEYRVPVNADRRGAFVEMLKTPDCGQFSYFTAHPGITRGEHYHHTKTEKFLVIKGTAHFGFRHIVTDETHELITRGGEARIVETVPGWTHNITNIGDDELIVMVWANEIFDRNRPDTQTMKVKPA